MSRSADTGLCAGVSATWGVPVALGCGRSGCRRCRDDGLEPSVPRYDCYRLLACRWKMTGLAVRAPDTAETLALRRVSRREARRPGRRVSAGWHPKKGWRRLVATGARGTRRVHRNYLDVSFALAPRLCVFSGSPKMRRPTPAKRPRAHTRATGRPRTRRGQRQRRRPAA